MTTISEKLKQIKSAKDSIKAAIIAKGGSFDGIASFEDYSKAIEALPASKSTVKVSITISYPNPFSANRYEYVRSSTSTPPTCSSLIINGKQLLDNTIRSGKDQHTFTTEVPANSTVSWVASPFYFRDRSNSSRYDTVDSWRISTTGTKGTQGSFTVSDGDYGIVLTPSSVSIGS